MRSRLSFLALLVFSVCPAYPQERFALTGIAVPESVSPPIIDVDYKGSAPDKSSPYLPKENWKVKWSATPGSRATAVKVDAVTVSDTVKKLKLQVSGNLPADVRAVYWTVLFDPGDSAPLSPQLALSQPNRRNQAKPPAADCSNSDVHQQPYFCPPGQGVTPDFSLTGSFLAAGGTKPIIAAELQSDLIFSSNRELRGFYPGITTAVEVNQNVQPPNNRTRFDPDSIRAGLTFTKIDPIQKSLLYGMEIQFQLPEGEFNRNDPSSNIIAGGLARFTFKPLKERSFYATLSPALGIETGRNLNRPSAVDMVPVDFSRYRGIFRGIVGADSSMGVASEDRTTDIFTITGSYRVRLPALDEPFAKTMHQVTTVDATTKARHWVEVDISSSPWNWKYFALNATYQYGSLPPLFAFVDHKFSIGFTLQAVQTRKPKLPTTSD